ncbi:MAG: formyltetrahydrofolate synthetase [Halieaceae bacterium]|jgi:formyltetrahydrofolate synthetase
MPTDMEIARQISAKPIQEIASQLNIDPEHILRYGKTIAKVHFDALERREATATT